MEEYEFIEASALEVNPENLLRIGQMDFVEVIEYDAEVTVLNAQSNTITGAREIQEEYTGEGITMAILDTGIDIEHGDLQNIAGRVDFTGSGIGDRHGHGTHVAGTAAGTGDESQGLYRGVAPSASILDVKVLDDNGTGRTSQTIKGIEYSVQNQADVISMSIGSEVPCTTLTASSRAVNAAVERGHIVVASAGNAGPATSTISNPGCADRAITVGATDRLDNIALFSSRGPTLEGNNKPDILAPGVGVISSNIGGGYTAMSGTSMSAPHVSGIIAQILEAEQLSPSEVKNLLKDTALDLGRSENAQGAGRVQADKAVEYIYDIDVQESSVYENEEQASERARYEGVEPRRVNIRTSDGVEYYVVDGRNEEGRFVSLWLDKESGELVIIRNMRLLQIIWMLISS